MERRRQSGYAAYVRDRGRVTLIKSSESTADTFSVSTVDSEIVSAVGSESAACADNESPETVDNAELQSRYNAFVQGRAEEELRRQYFRMEVAVSQILQNTRPERLE